MATCDYGFRARRYAPPRNDEEDSAVLHFGKIQADRQRHHERSDCLQLFHLVHILRLLGNFLHETFHTAFGSVTYVSVQNFGAPWLRVLNQPFQALHIRLAIRKLPANLAAQSQIPCRLQSARQRRACAFE